MSAEVGRWGFKDAVEGRCHVGCAAESAALGNFGERERGVGDERLRAVDLRLVNRFVKGVSGLGLEVDFQFAPGASDLPGELGNEDCLLRGFADEFLASGDVRMLL